MSRIRTERSWLMTILLGGRSPVVLYGCALTQSRTTGSLRKEKCEKQGGQWDSETASCKPRPASADQKDPCQGMTGIFYSACKKRRSHR